MKHDNNSRHQSQQPPRVAQATPAMESKKNETALVPSADEVARKAYFTYVNEGSVPGHDVQHWLAAEADLISERNLTRTHGYHNQT